MANAHEGWDPELFVVPPSEDDLCNICCQVLHDAVETGCGHSFCEKCIKGWLEQRSVCPQDQKALSWADCRPMVRDRRRILDLKVKCPWCETQMELRSLTEHKKSKCSKKPVDAEEEEDKEPVVEEKVEEDKGEEAEYVIEFEAGEEGEQDHKIEEKREKEIKEAQERDQIFAAQLQEEERMRNLSVRPGGSPRSPSVQQNRPLTPQVQLVDVGGGAVIEYYQADEIGEGVEGQEGQPDKRLRQVKQQSGCCGCSDRCWCCMCCFFWILLLVLGVSIWFWGVSGTAAKVGL